MITRRNATAWIMIVFVLLFAFVSHMISADPGHDVFFSTVIQSVSSTIEDERTLIITDNNTWTQIWIEAHDVRGPPPSVPIVDFNNEWLVAIFLGPRSHSGYGVNITRIGKTLFQYVVYYEELDYGGGAGEVYPVHIVKVSNYSLDLP
ncbi:MAG: hypothetical protein ACXAEF_15495, partial [Candidatus Thorarchaeota archaeon]